MENDFKELFFRGISLVLCFWKEVTLSLFFVFSVCFLLEPYTTTYIVSWIFLFLAFLGIIFLWRQEIKKKSRSSSYIKLASDTKSTLLNDKEISDISFDKLDLGNDIEVFANQVIDNGKNNPIIFGLDAPWGSGKSSYLNLCKTLVWDKSKNKPIVFRFNPILFDSSKQDLSVVFVEQFIKTLKEEGVTVDRLNSDLKKLFQSIKGITIGGVSFDLLTSKPSIEGILEDVRNHVKSIPRKVIIIVDDLDRLYLEDIKVILGIIRNVFYVDNITFILCYDSNSINTFETQYKIIHKNTFGKELNDLKRDRYTRSEVDLDNRKINSYLEKFVQIKKTLVPDREQLSNLFKSLIQEINQDKNNPSIKKLEEGIDIIFSPESYWRYQPLIGDIRKIKRVFNFLYSASLIGIDDFHERDIDLSVLLRLTLIYINHPHVFQKIYISETGGAKGFFSAIRSMDLDKKDEKYSNSNQFFNYIRSLSDEESFLLHELFCVKCAQGNCKRKEWVGHDFSKDLFDEKDFERKSPMFNGNDFAYSNLEDYLKIIQNHKLLPRSRYHAFHVNRIEELEYKTVEGVFESTEEYAVKYGEQPREKFFENAQTKGVSVRAADKIINYIVKNIHRYSLVNDFSGVYDGIRDDLMYRLLWILELRGWTDEDGESFGNDEEHIKPIAIRLLEKEVSLNKSIVDALLNVQHQPLLAILDVMRLYGSCVESNSLFNLRRSIDGYAKEKGINLGEFFSQKVFSFFRENYIDKDINFLKEVHEMEPSILLGDFSEAISEQFISQKSSLSDEILKMKSSVVASLLYRFSQDGPKLMGCHNDADNPGKKIYETMREYLFENCFNIEKDVSNAVYFINYAFTSYVDVVSRSQRWKPSASALEKVFGAQELKSYWQKNHKKITEYCSALPADTQVFTYNYGVVYKNDLGDLLMELDTKLLA